MRRYSEAVKADVRRRMSPPHRQSVALISEELGIHVITLYKWGKALRLQGEVVPASEKDPEGWSATEKSTVVLETAGLNATELSAYCRERGLFPEQVERWPQASQHANDRQCSPCRRSPASLPSRESRKKLKSYAPRLVEDQAPEAGAAP
jgi:transposase